MEFEGHVTLRGVAHFTKGARAELNGTILRFAGKDRAERRQLVGTLIGQFVVAEGDRCVRYCGPQEQCLTSGSVPYLENTRILETRPQGSDDAGTSRESP